MVPLSIRLRRPLAGLQWFTRDSNGNMIVASRHWPHLNCWSWSLTWKWPDGKSGSHHVWGFHYAMFNGSGWFVAGPLWLNYQTFNRQNARLRQRGSYCIDLSKV